MAGKSFVFRFADIEAHEREFSLVRSGETIAVEPKAFRVLLILLRNPQKLIPKEELLNAVWSDAAVTENSLTRAIALLRKVLGDDAREPRFIETVATVGYRWICPVEQREDLSAFALAGEAAVAEFNAAPAPLVGAAVPASRKRGRGPLWIGLAMTVILVAGAIWYFVRPLQPPRITAYNQITHDGRLKNVAGIDGSRIYFTQYSSTSVGQVGMNGGEAATAPIAVPEFFEDLMDISPDGSNALLRADLPGTPNDAIWVAPTLGGSPRRIGAGEGESFSPDGASVIYQNVDGEIVLARVDGSGTRTLARTGSKDPIRLTPNPLAGDFRWSPDGKIIRFDRGGALWEMAADGSGLHRLLPEWKESGAQCCGIWTPDGQFYLFEVASSVTHSELWALDERRRLFGAAHLTPIPLTSGLTTWRQPIPSRDGKKIFVDGVTPRGELTRIDPKTGGAEPYLGGISAEEVSFSPDGKSIAYKLFPEVSLWKANRDGSHPELLFESKDLSAGVPRWSPDSREILFAVVSHDQHFSVYRISADGGRAEKLLPKDNGSTGDGVWSPDGKRVLFARLGFYRQPGALGLRILDLASGKETAVPGGETRWSPRWSPNGRYIAALHLQGGLDLFDWTTKRWTVLSADEGEGSPQYPAFSHDSRYLYYLRPGEQGVYRIALTGGKEERVADLSRWRLTGFFGFSMTLDPSDGPLVLRDIGSDDIYALTLEP
jgi:DNA-binding winged helix-turn-helix (wHTH) protein/Tol biopolymer transport system component